MMHGQKSIKLKKIIYEDSNKIRVKLHNRNCSWRRKMEYIQMLRVDNSNKKTDWGLYDGYY